MRHTFQFDLVRCRSVLFIFGLAALLFSAGCAGAVGGSNSSSGIQGLSVTPASLSFGSVNTGGSATQSATLTNSGSSLISITNVSVSGAGFSVSGVPSGLTLSPGQSATLTAKFSPASTGAVTGGATLTTSDASAAVPLSGTGVSGASHAVTLIWAPSTSKVAGYRAYRATSSGGQYTALNSAVNPLLQYTDSTVQPGATYYYVVTSVAADSTESLYSSQVSAVIPKP
jgi:hypothetical protein